MRPNIPRAVLRLALLAGVFYHVTADVGRPAKHFNLGYIGYTTATLATYTFAVEVNLKEIVNNVKMSEDFKDGAEKHYSSGSGSAQITECHIRRIRFTLDNTRALFTPVDLSTRREKRAAYRAIWRGQEGVYDGHEWRSINRTHYHNSTDGSSRPKRNIFAAVGLGIKVATTLWGLYRQPSINKLADQMDLQKGRTDDLFLIAEDHSNALGTIALQIEDLNKMAARSNEKFADFQDEVRAHNFIWSVLTDIEGQANRAATVADAALNQRLSHQAMPPGVMGKILDQVRKESKAAGYKLLVETQAEAFQCQASFRATTDGFAVFLHLPLTEIDGEDNMYRYVQVNIPVGEGKHMVVYPRLDIISVDTEQQYFRAFSSADLTECHKRGMLHTCDRGNMKTLLTVPEDYQGGLDDQLCIYFIYKQEYNNVIRACEFHLREPANGGFVISGTEYVFVGRAPHPGTLSCPGQQPQSFTVVGPTAVTVPKGCDAATAYFKAKGHDNTLEDTTQVSWDWPLDVKLLLQGLDLDRLAALQKERPQESIPADIQRIKSLLETDRLIKKGLRDTDKRVEDGLLEADRRASSGSLSTTTYVMVGVTVVLAIAVAGLGTFTFIHRATFVARFTKIAADMVDKVLHHLREAGMDVAGLRARLLQRREQPRLQEGEEENAA